MVSSEVNACIFRKLTVILQQFLVIVIDNRLSLLCKTKIKNHRFLYFLCRKLRYEKTITPLFTCYYFFVSS